MDNTLISTVKLCQERCHGLTMSWPAFALAAVAVLAGCTGSRTFLVEVDAVIPEPLIEPAPFTVGVYFSPEFYDVTTQEQSLLGDTWSVAFGDLQQRYFLTMVQRAFRDVQVIDADSLDLALSQLREAPNAYDFVVAPRADNFAFLTPAESGTKFFAVSMRHYVDFYTGDGAQVGAWEINSYGRSRSTFAASQVRLATEACQDAVRDMATSIVVGMPEQLLAIGLVRPPPDAPEVN